MDGLGNGLAQTRRPPRDSMIQSRSVGNSLRLPSRGSILRERRQREADCHLDFALDLDPTIQEGVLGIEFAASKPSVDAFVEANRRTRFGRGGFDSEGREEFETTLSDAFENETSAEFSETADALGGQAHFIAETRQTAQKSEERISTLTSDTREVFECVAQNQERSACGLIDASHMTPVDVEEMPLKGVPAVDLNHDRCPYGFHLLEHSRRGRVAACGGALFFECAVELFWNAFLVEDALLFESAHRRRRRWNRSTAATCSA